MSQAIDEQFDHLLMSEKFLDDPYPAFDVLRAEAPVYWSAAWDCWLVTGYWQTVALFKDSANFSNIGRYNSLFESLPPDVRADVKQLEDHYRHDVGLIHSDPPDHTRLRKLMHLAFTPRTIREMRPQVEQIVHGFLDAVQAAGIWSSFTTLPIRCLLRL
jgi:cytochrome P450